MNKFVETNNNHLKCPHCGHESLRQGSVRVAFDQGERKGFGKFANAGPEGTFIKVVERTAIPGDIHAAAICFHCDECTNLAYLAIRSIQGSTILEWVDTDDSFVKL